MDKNRLLAIGGIGISIVGAFLYFTKKKVVQVSKNSLIRALEDLKIQSLTLFNTTAQVVEKLVSESGGKYELGNGKNVGDLIRDEITKELEEKKRVILIQQNIDEDDFSNAIEGPYSQDQDVQKIVDEIFGALENALKGIYPSLEVRPQIYEILTKEVTLKLVKKILIFSLKCTLSILNDFKSQGQGNISMDDPKFLRKIGELNMKEKKNQLIKSEGICVDPDIPVEVLGKVSQSYKLKDENYNKQLSQIGLKYTKVLPNLGKSVTTDEQIEIDFEKND